MEIVRSFASVQEPTTTVPFMKGWNEQMYAKLPAVSKVAVPIAPGSIAPASNPPDSVAVCFWLSLLVHVTVPPTATCTSEGPNLNCLMSTLAVVGRSAAAVVVADPAVVGAAVLAGAAVVATAAVVDDDLLSVPHDAAIAVSTRTAVRVPRQRFIELCSAPSAQPDERFLDEPARAAPLAARAYGRGMAIDIENLTTLADPYPAHAELRDRGVHQLDDGRWIVARAHDVEHVLGEVNAIIGFEAADPAATVQSRMARFTDGPAHARRREVATSALDRLDPGSLERHALDLTTTRLVDVDEIDVMAALARAVPIAALAAALGLEPTTAAGAAVDLALAIAPPRGASRGDAESPIRRICAAAGAAPALSDADINTAALLFQAVDATAGLIGNSVVTASRLGVPAGAAAVDFVREVSRFDPAVHFTTRRAAAELEVGGMRIPAGSTILVDLAASGRDPARWTDPDVLRPSRDAPSFAFGDGIHRCPGRDEALALAAGVFAAIFDRGGRQAPGDVAYEPRFNLRIPAQINWTVGPRPAA